MLNSLTRKLAMSALSLFLAGGLIVAAVGVNAQDKVVRVAVPTEPPSIDPHIGIGGAYNIIQSIFDTLVKVDFDLNVVPRLATSWEQLDELTWRFKLVEGTKYHSGNPFNAKALKAWVESMVNKDDPSVNVPWMRHIARTEVVDEYTIDFHLKNPFGPFLRSMALPHLSIYDAKERARLGSKFGEKPSGTGPFRFKEWRRGQMLILERNPDYRDKGKPKVDVLEMRFIPEPSSRISMLETDEVDIAYALPGHQIPRMEAIPDVTPLTAAAMRPIHWFYNMKNKTLMDSGVRRALIYAVDMEKIGKTILSHGGGIVLNGFVTPGAYGALETPFGYDPEYARQLLLKSGWKKNSDGFYAKDGKTLTLTAMVGFDRFPDILPVAEAAQGMLRKFGVDFRINSVEQSSLEATYYSGRKLPPDNTVGPNYEIITIGAGIRDGQTYGAWNGHFTKGGFTHTTGHWSNPQFDKLFQIAISPVPERVQLRAYHDAQKLMYAEVPSFPLYSPVWVIGVRSRISGFRPHQTGQEFWEMLELKR